MSAFDMEKNLTLTILTHLDFYETIIIDVFGVKVRDLLCVCVCVCVCECVCRVNLNPSPTSPPTVPNELIWWRPLTSPGGPDGAGVMITMSILHWSSIPINRVCKTHDEWIQLFTHTHTCSLTHTRTHARTHTLALRPDSCRSRSCSLDREKFSTVLGSHGYEFRTGYPNAEPWTHVPPWTITCEKRRLKRRLECFRQDDVGSPVRQKYVIFCLVNGDKNVMISVIYVWCDRAWCDVMWHDNLTELISESFSNRNLWLGDRGGKGSEWVSEWVGGWWTSSITVNASRVCTWEDKSLSALSWSSVLSEQNPCFTSDLVMHLCDDR